MSKYYASGKIVTVNSGTSYQGAVYDQNVTFELKNGMRLELFDHKMLVAPAMAGTNKRVLIGLLDTAFPEMLRRKKVTVREKKITHKKGYDIYGEIVHKVPNTSYKVPMEDCMVDFGVGQMRITTTAREFKIGDFIHAHASRLDVDAVFDDA